MVYAVLMYSCTDTVCCGRWWQLLDECCFTVHECTTRHRSTTETNCLRKLGRLLNTYVTTTSMAVGSRVAECQHTRWRTLLHRRGLTAGCYISRCALPWIRCLSLVNDELQCWVCLASLQQNQLFHVCNCQACDSSLMLNNLWAWITWQSDAESSSHVVFAEFLGDHL